MNDTTPTPSLRITHDEGNQHTLRSTNTTGWAIATLMNAINATPGTSDVKPEGRPGRIQFRLAEPMTQGELDELADEWAGWID